MTDVPKDAAKDPQSPANSPDDAVFTVDVNGAVLEWNAAMEQLTGRARDSVLGKPASALQCPGCAIPTCPFAPQDLAALTDSDGKSVETCLRHNDGEIIPVYKTAQPLHAPDGKVSGAEIFLDRIS